MKRAIFFGSVAVVRLVEPFAGEQWTKPNKTKSNYFRKAHLRANANIFRFTSFVNVECELNFGCLPSHRAGNDDLLLEQISNSIKQSKLILCWHSFLFLSRWLRSGLFGMKKRQKFLLGLEKWSWLMANVSITVLNCEHYGSEWLKRNNKVFVYYSNAIIEGSLLG